MDLFGSVRFLFGIDCVIALIKEVYAVMFIAAFKLYPLVFVTF